MNKKEKYLKLTLSVILSSLLTVLAVFGIVYAQSYLHQDALVVKGTAQIESSAEIFGAVKINTTGWILGLLVPKGRVGIGLEGEAPQAKLHVAGDVRIDRSTVNPANFTNPEIKKYLPINVNGTAYYLPLYGEASPPTIAAPSSLTATNRELDWTDNSNNEDRFEIERRDDIVGTVFAYLDEVGANVTNFFDGSSFAGNTYWYRVKACRGGSCSGYSTEVSDTPLGD